MTVRPAPDPSIAAIGLPLRHPRDIREVLRETFGFADFRGRQEEVVTRVMDGHSTLAVMPTGAGKSLT